MSAKIFQNHLLFLIAIISILVISVQPLVWSEPDTEDILPEQGDGQLQSEEDKDEPEESDSIEESLEINTLVPEEADAEILTESEATVVDKLSIETKFSNLKLRIGGNLLVDVGRWDSSSSIREIFGDDSGETDVRKGLIEIRAQLNQNLNFTFQIEDESGEFELGNIYIEREKILFLGKIRIGNFVEPYSLERVTSLRYQTFMERSLATAFTPGKNLGGMISNTQFDGRMTWSVGIFESTDTADSAADAGGLSYVGRFTGLPIFKDKGAELLHVGLSYTHEKPEKQFNIRPRPESYLAPRYLNTGKIDMDSFDAATLELAYVKGPWSIQSEYTWMFMENAMVGIAPAVASRASTSGDPVLHGGYLQASYFLTGEYRTYNIRKGAFGQTNPTRPVTRNSDSSGKGAFELAARISRIDLNSNPIRGGVEENATLGLNWYLNKHVRFTVNYTYADIDTDSYSGHSQIFQTRFQLDFQGKELGELRTYTPFGHKR